MSNLTSQSLKNTLASKMTSIQNPGSDGIDIINNTMKSINEKNSNSMIKKTFKKSEITDLLSNKKTKMNLPIGKLTSMGKNETKEATGSGSGGGFVTAFGGEMKEKWSQKYKDSINCSNPKGFSQKAHCQGKKKKQQNEGEFKAPKLTMFSDEAPKKIKKSQITKTETKEATGSASAGSYVTPAAWSKSLDKKDWRGKSKTLFPGGKFVQVKKKCKTFPYCNQGDINALNLTNEGKMGKVISKLSEKYNITEDFVRKLIIKEYRKGK